MRVGSLPWSALSVGRQRRGLGFDPSHESENLDELAIGRVEVRREYFDESSGDVEAELVCARHLLEHIEDPLGLLQSMRRTLDGTSTTMYFEVRNRSPGPGTTVEMGLDVRALRVYFTTRITRVAVSASRLWGARGQRGLWGVNSSASKPDPMRRAQPR